MDYLTFVPFVHSGLQFINFFFKRILLQNNLYSTLLYNFFYPVSTRVKFTSTFRQRIFKLLQNTKTCAVAACEYFNSDRPTSLSAFVLPPPSPSQKYRYLKVYLFLIFFTLPTYVLRDFRFT